MIYICCLTNLLSGQNITFLTGQNGSVGKYDKLEFTVELPATIWTAINNFIAGSSINPKINPYNPDLDGIDVQAIFTSPSGNKKVIYGFYHQKVQRNGTLYIYPSNSSSFNVRFSPDEVGKWRFYVTIKANGHSLIQSSEYTFKCTNSQNKGRLMISPNKRTLQFSNGESFYAIGENVYWAEEDYGRDADDYLKQHKIIEELSDQGGNFARIGLTTFDLNLEWQKLGTYNQNISFEIDELIDKAKALDIYYQFVIESLNGLSIHDWHGYPITENPYFKFLGLNTSNPIEMFSNSNTRKHYKRKLRYIVSRWGYSSNIGIWEIANELYNPQFAKPDEVFHKTNWVHEMADYVKNVLGDTNRLMTVSWPFDVMPTIGNSVFDIISIHYYQMIRKVAHDRYNFLNKYWTLYKKPAHFGEMSLGGGHSPEDCSDLSFHNAIWSTSFMGGWGCGANWWWDNAIHSNGFYKNFKPLTSFFSNINMNEFYTPHMFFPETMQDPLSLFNKINEAYYVTNEDNTKAIGWAHNTSYYWHNFPDMYSCFEKEKEKNPMWSDFPISDDDSYDTPYFGDPNQKNQIFIEGIAEGDYKIEWYQTRVPNKILKSEYVTSTKIYEFEGILCALPLTLANPDLAFKVFPEKQPPYSVSINKGGRHGDFNGDGKIDLLHFGENSTAVSINKGITANQGQFEFNNWQVAKRGIFDFWTVGDFNGDGKDDVLNSYTTEGIKVFLSNGTSFLPGNVWAGYGVAAEKFWTVGDFNGDGKDDLLRTEAGIGVQVLISSGTAFQNPIKWTGSEFASEGFWTIGDFNGDDKDDILRTETGVGTQVLISSGASFLNPAAWAPQIYGQIEKSWMVGDFNNDGKDDILRSKFMAGDDDIEVLLSNGKSFSSPQKWAKINLATGIGMVGDFNGDKLSDILYLDKSNKMVCLSNGKKFGSPVKWQ